MTEIVDSASDTSGSVDVIVVHTCHVCDNVFTYDAENEKHYATTISKYSYDDQSWHSSELFACENCTIECNDCDRYTTDYKIEGRWVHRGYCFECSEHYRDCDRCNVVFHQDDIYYIGNSDSCYCENCRERVASWCNECDHYEYHDDMCNSRGSSDYVHSYSYKPDPEFHGVSDSHLHFGIELEVEAHTGDYAWGAELVDTNWNEFVYLKEDSSLEFGFEIVTHPATLEYFQNEVDWSVLDTLRQGGFRSWSAGSCGLHVHIDRRAFSNRTHLLAFTYLINRNPSLCRHIAGRNSHYGIVSESSKIDNVLTVKNRYRDARGGDRYNAVNLQNLHTVEIRMFKGSLKPERVRSGIQFCHAAIEYTREIRSGSTATIMLKPEEFCSWVRKQGKYPDLVSYLPDFIVNVNEDTE